MPFECKPTVVNINFLFPFLHSFQFNSVQFNGTDVLSDAVHYVLFSAELDLNK